MQWDNGLLDDQKKAASHTGCHTRLLAGPGTGKTLTLTCHAAYLVTEKGIPPSQILAITFTRAASFELRNRIANLLGDHEDELPRVSTLHTFALRQLLRNSDRVKTIPQPLRIADDWEERNIILEDLKTILSYDLKTVRERFDLLSADWQKLVADEEGWESRFIDARFLGAWRQHREIFGYTLRSELVYQLKRTLEQTEECSLESDYLHLLVDEYQDMNRCDLAVISAIRDRGVEIFGAGDDDQSIYGFRYAHPEGIRRFESEHVPSTSLTLETCVRCDRNIINFASFVANLDPNRLPKPLKPRIGSGEGNVHILRFTKQDDESYGIAKICRYLLDIKSYAPKDVLILMRNDRKGVFSSVIRHALEVQNVPVSVQVGGTPLDTEQGRIFLSVLRLLADDKDSLALRTLLMLRDNHMGMESYSKIYSLACEIGDTFYSIVSNVATEPGLIKQLGARIRCEMYEIQDIIERHREHFKALLDSSSSDELLDSLRVLAVDIIEDPNVQTILLQFLESIIKETNSTNHIELLRGFSSSLENEEQELDSERVNIMTMHKAKGLTANAVVIIAAEDEYIPGRQTGEKEGDERRLLYVSLSRARHFLAVTYCERRTGPQRYTGRTRGQNRRTFTRFLKDAPIAPINGKAFVESLGT